MKELQKRIPALISRGISFKIQNGITCEIPEKIAGGILVEKEFFTEYQKKFQLDSQVALIENS